MMMISPQSKVDKEGGPFKKFKLQYQPILGFSEVDKEGMIQLHDDALVVTLRIMGFDVKRVMIDQESGAKIMSPYLYKGLGLKLGDLSKYDTLLVRFDRKTIVPRVMIRLLVHMGMQVVNVDFIVVEVYSPYTAILVRPWLYAKGTVSLTLHVKLKYPIEEGVGELLGCQAVARQCMVVAVRH
nr:uncharacterized protein LOC111997176 [Quercus suber]